MIGEIIAIGDELTSGRIANTTSGYAASRLFAAGHEIFAMHTLGDTPELIGEALKRAIRRVDFVIVTGGLGPTSDDLTNEAVAAALNRPPTLYREILEKIEPCHQGAENDQISLEKLAWLPRGAEVLNAHSRMAGYLLVYDSTPIFFLPGIPDQMKQLFSEHVLPFLAGWTSDDRNHIRQRIYRTFGLTENVINRKLATIEREEHLKIGYYPVDSEVHVSLTVTGGGREESEELFKRTDSRITAILGDQVYGHDHDSMAKVVGRLLLERGWTLSMAESCTGGLVAAKMTEVPGSSAWFCGGIVAYSNDLKKQLLGVAPDLLEKHGAVSKAVAAAMAEGAWQRTGSEISVAVTGIAGPSGGTEEKPVGTVYIGVCVRGATTCSLHHFSGSRREIQEVTAMTALDLVRRAGLADR